jgi:ElaB/YqjD/DUF883 family membrane-anchored ribosome-binding protein
MGIAAVQGKRTVRIHSLRTAIPCHTTRGNTMSKAAEADIHTRQPGGRDSFDSESERLAQVIHDAIDRVTERAAGAEQKVRSAGEEVREKADNAQQRARASTREAEQAVEGYIDRHPWTAVGVAFGAGIVLSLFLRR